jgi:hypothetical protein
MPTQLTAMWLQLIQPHFQINAGNASVSGNVTANVFIGNGSQLTNVVATTAATITDNAQPNITSVGTLTSLSVTGNVDTGNVYTPGQVSATGNITGSFIIGNGSQLTGLPPAYANANAQAYFASGTSNANISITGNILTTADVSATGNITGSYIIGNGRFLTGMPELYGNAM